MEPWLPYYPERPLSDQEMQGVARNSPGGRPHAVWFLAYLAVQAMLILPFCVSQNCCSYRRCRRRKGASTQRCANCVAVSAAALMLLALLAAVFQFNVLQPGLHAAECPELRALHGRLLGSDYLDAADKRFRELFSTYAALVGSVFSGSQGIESPPELLLLREAGEDFSVILQGPPAYFVLLDRQEDNAQLVFTNHTTNLFASDTFGELQVLGTLGLDIFGEDAQLFNRSKTTDELLHILTFPEGILDSFSGSSFAESFKRRSSERGKRLQALAASLEAQGGAAQALYDGSPCQRRLVRGLPALQSTRAILGSSRTASVAICVAALCALELMLAPFVVACGKANAVAATYSGYLAGAAAVLSLCLTAYHFELVAMRQFHATVVTRSDFSSLCHCVGGETLTLRMPELEGLFFSPAELALSMKSEAQFIDDFAVYAEYNGRLQVSANAFTDIALSATVRLIELPDLGSSRPGADYLTFNGLPYREFLGGTLEPQLRRFSQRYELFDVSDNLARFQALFDAAVGYSEARAPRCARMRIAQRLATLNVHRAATDTLPVRPQLADGLTLRITGYQQFMLCYSLLNSQDYRVESVVTLTEDFLVFLGAVQFASYFTDKMTFEETRGATDRYIAMPIFALGELIRGGRELYHYRLGDLEQFATHVGTEAFAQEFRSKVSQSADYLRRTRQAFGYARYGPPEGNYTQRLLNALDALLYAARYQRLDAVSRLLNQTAFQLSLDAHQEEICLSARNSVQLLRQRLGTSVDVAEVWERIGAVLDQEQALLEDLTGKQLGEAAASAVGAEALLCGKVGFAVVVCFACSAAFVAFGVLGTNGMPHHAARPVAHEQLAEYEVCQDDALQLQEWIMIPVGR